MNTCTNKVVLLILALLINVAPAISQEYILTDLGRLGTSNSQARSINGLGHITGYSVPQCDEGVCTHAFHWNRGMSDIGVLLENSPINLGLSINDQGLIVGMAQIFTGPPKNNTRLYAVYWNLETGEVGTLPSLENNQTAANDVNNLGDIVGNSMLANNTNRAVAWYSGKLHNLGILAGGTSSRATSINNFGLIVGSSTTNGGFLQSAVKWQAGQIASLPLPGGATSKYATATAVNDSGHIVGYYNKPDDSPRALKWLSNQIVQLSSALPSKAWDINNRGQVVGEIIDAPILNGSFAAIWEGQGVIDLNQLTYNPSGWFLRYAYSINDLGQIVGSGYPPPPPSGLHSRAFLLTPVCLFADFNKDDLVEPIDLLLFRRAFFQGAPEADVNMYNGVDERDYKDFVAAIRACALKKKRSQAP